MYIRNGEWGITADAITIKKDKYYEKIYYKYIFYYEKDKIL